MNDSEHNKTIWQTFKELSAYFQVMAALGWHQQHSARHAKAGCFSHYGRHSVTYGSSCDLSAVRSWHDGESSLSDMNLEVLLVHVKYIKWRSARQIQILHAELSTTYILLSIYCF